MANNNWDIGLGLRLKPDAIENIQKKIDAIGQNKSVTLKIDNSEALKQINAVKKQIESLSQVKITIGNVNTASNNNNVQVPKIIDGASTKSIYTVTEAYKELKNVIQQIGSKELNLQNLDLKTNPEQIKALKNQLKDLYAEFDKIMDEYSGRFTLVQENDINRLLGNYSRKSQQLSSKLTDTTNVQENINAYQKLLDLQNQISSKKISVAKLDGNKDKEYITVLTSQLNKLQQEYNSLKAQLSSKLSIGQIEELDNVAKDTADKIEVLSAKFYDLKIAEENSNYAKELQADFKKLIDTAKEIGNLKIKIQGLENSGKNSSRINNLNTQLEQLEATYQRLYSEFDVKGGFATLSSEDLSKLASVAANTNTKLKDLEATYIDAQTKIANKRIDLANSIKADFIGTGKFSTDIAKVQADFQKLGIENESVTNGITTLRSLLSTMSESNDVEEVIKSYETYQQVLKSTQNDVKQLQINAAQASATLSLNAKKDKMNRSIELWFKNNSALAKKFGIEMRNIQAQIKSADATKLNALQDQLEAVKVKAQLAGGSALTFGDRLKAQLSKLGIYFSGIMLITRSVQVIKNMVNSVIDLDTSLIDLKKTTTATNEELQAFYFNANDIGKELGTTTKAVVQAAADWSRLGYNIKDAQEMAKTSSIFASISPNVDIEKATDGLVSAMKAYKIEASDALDGVASKINIIGNTQAVSNEDIVEFLTRSSSAMAVANNTLDETIALGTAITEVTRDAANAGQVMKTNILSLHIEICA